MIFNMYKVRYAEIGDMLGDLPKGSVQIFINLEPVLRRLHQVEVDKYLKTNKDKKLYEMISNILNLAAHYRKYFTKIGRSTEIVLYMSSPNAKFINGQIIEDYRSNNYLKLFDPRTVYGRFLKDVIPLVELMVNYIEGLYFIHSDTLEPSLIPMVVKNDMPNKIMITTDRYDYQYVNQDFTIIRPKKSGSSYAVNKHNIIDRMKLEDKILSDKMVNPNFIPLILSFLGDTVRGLPKIKGVGLHRIINIINDGIEKGFITENTTNLTLMETLLNDDIKDVIRNNFIVTDLKLQYDNIGKSTLLLINEKKVDRFDNDSLRKLNNYFIESPVMLNELQPLKEKKSIFEM